MAENKNLAKERAENELKELKDKYSKLKAMYNSDLFNKMSAGEKNLIYRQDAAMSMYIDVLSSRIKIWREI